MTFTLMQRTADTNETSWAHALYFYHGVEAIAFAAAGFFLGREVQRRRADEAERKADDAQQRETTARAGPVGRRCGARRR